MNPNQYQIAMRPADGEQNNLRLEPFNPLGFLDELFGGTPPLLSALSMLTIFSPRVGTPPCSTRGKTRLRRLPCRCLRT